MVIEFNCHVSVYRFQLFKSLDPDTFPPKLNAQQKDIDFLIANSRDLHPLPISDAFFLKAVYLLCRIEKAKTRTLRREYNLKYNTYLFFVINVTGGMLHVPLRSLLSNISQIYALTPLIYTSYMLSIKDEVHG